MPKRSAGEFRLSLYGRLIAGETVADLSEVLGALCHNGDAVIDDVEQDPLAPPGSSEMSRTPSSPDLLLPDPTARSSICHIDC